MFILPTSVAFISSLLPFIFDVITYIGQICSIFTRMCGYFECVQSKQLFPILYFPTRPSQATYLIYNYSYHATFFILLWIKNVSHSLEKFILFHMWKIKQNSIKSFFRAIYENFSHSFFSLFFKIISRYRPFFISYLNVPHRFQFYLHGEFFRPKGMLSNYYVPSQFEFWILTILCYILSQHSQCISYERIDYYLLTRKFDLFGKEDRKTLLEIN